MISRVVRAEFHTRRSKSLQRARPRSPQSSAVLHASSSASWSQALESGFFRCELRQALLPQCAKTRRSPCCLFVYGSRRSWARALQAPRTGADRQNGSHVSTLDNPAEPCSSNVLHHVRVGLRVRSHPKSHAPAATGSRGRRTLHSRRPQNHSPCRAEPRSTWRRRNLAGRVAGNIAPPGHTLGPPGATGPRPLT